MLRIAQELQVGASRVLLRQSDTEGLLVSAELLGVILLGFQGEPADSVIRCARNIPHHSDLLSLKKVLFSLRVTQQPLEFLKPIQECHRP